MSPRAALVVSALSLTGCAGLQGPDASNATADCTADNAFRLGSQARAYLGGCPKNLESAFLDGLYRGRALVPPTPQAQGYLAQMTELEKQLLSAGSDAERQRLRARLQEAEWWAVHIINSPGSYSIDS